MHFFRSSKHGYNLLKYNEISGTCFSILFQCPTLGGGPNEFALTIDIEAIWIDHTALNVIRLPWRFLILPIFINSSIFRLNFVFPTCLRLLINNVSLLFQISRCKFKNFFSLILPLNYKIKINSNSYALIKNCMILIHQVRSYRIGAHYFYTIVIHKKAITMYSANTKHDTTLNRAWWVTSKSPGLFLSL